GCEPRKVLLDIAADLQLEIAVSVGLDHFLKALRQAVVEPLAVRLGTCRRIEEPHGVARVDRGRALEAGEEFAEVETREIVRGRGVEPKTIGVRQCEDRRAL